MCYHSLLYDGRQRPPLYTCILSVKCTYFRLNRVTLYTNNLLWARCTCTNPCTLYTNVWGVKCQSKMSCTLYTKVLGVKCQRKMSCYSDNLLPKRWYRVYMEMCMYTALVSYWCRVSIYFSKVCTLYTYYIGVKLTAAVGHRIIEPHEQHSSKIRLFVFITTIANFVSTGDCEYYVAISYLYDMRENI